MKVERFPVRKPLEFQPFKVTLEFETMREAYQMLGLLDFPALLGGNAIRVFQAIYDGLLEQEKFVFGVVDKYKQEVKEIVND